MLHAGQHGLGAGLRSSAFLLLPSVCSLILICEIKCCDLVQVIEFPMIHFDKWRNGRSEVTPMLAEKFFLVLETLKSHAPTMEAQLWRPPRSISQSSCRHVGRDAVPPKGFRN